MSELATAAGGRQRKVRTDDGVVVAFHDQWDGDDDGPVEDAEVVPDDHCVGGDMSDVDEGWANRSGMQRSILPTTRVGGEEWVTYEGW